MAVSTLCWCVNRCWKSSQLSEGVGATSGLRNKFFCRLLLSMFRSLLRAHWVTDGPWVVEAGTTVAIDDIPWGKGTGCYHPLVKADRVEGRLVFPFLSSRSQDTA